MTMDHSTVQMFEQMGGFMAQHTLKKKVSDFPVPSQDVTNQTLPGRE